MGGLKIQILRLGVTMASQTLTSLRVHFHGDVLVNRMK